MSLSQALASAAAGLRVTQSGMAILASNVANADTPGYTRKTSTQVTTGGSGSGIGVRVESINRQLDIYLQRQLRTETSGASYADLRAQFYDRLQSVYGAPGSASALTTIFDNFVGAVQALTVSPDSAAQRSAVLSSAQVLAQQLNSMTQDIQGLRSDAELGLADATARANEAMKQIADINRQLAGAPRNDATTASLLDNRDRYIDQLSQLMDITVVPGDSNQVTVFTGSGIQLAGLQASQIKFDAKGAIGANSQWSEDPAQRSVGTLTLVSPTGGGLDLIADGAIRSGEIAAYLEMRDKVLVEAQAQLDQIASALASALSDKSIAGTPVTSGAQAGFDLDVGSLAAGNAVHITYTDASGAQRKLTLMRVDDPAALPLDNSATADPNDRVIGLDFSGGIGAVADQLNAVLGTTGLQFSNPSGTTLRVLDDGNGNNVTIRAASATVTETSLTGGSAELPLFMDGNASYTGAITAGGSQSTGFAGRISVNASLLLDPSRLTVFSTSSPTENANSTRADFIYDRLTNAALSFSPDAGIGTTTAPFTGSLQSYLRQAVSQQGNAAASAASLQEGQGMVLASLQQRFDETSGVNVDVELANLLNLQNAYAANARVMTTVRDMIDTLLKM